MKNFFYVNNKPQPTGEHVVHTRDCWVLPNDRKYIGRYPTFDEAIQGAKDYYTSVDRCSYCLKEPHPAYR